MKDFTRDFLIAASKERKEILCETYDKAIEIRQKLYGTKTKMRNRLDIDFAKADATEIRVLDRNHNKIKPNSKEFREIRAIKGDSLYTPCYLVGEPRNIRYADAFQQALKDDIEKGELASQIEARQAKELEQATIERLERQSRPIPNALDLLRQSDMQREKEAQSKTAYNFPEKPKIESPRETTEEEDNNKN